MICRKTTMHLSMQHKQTKPNIVRGPILREQVTEQWHWWDIKTEVAKGNGYSEQANDCQKYHLHWATQTYFYADPSLLPKTIGLWCLNEDFEKKKKVRASIFSVWLQGGEKNERFFFSENGPDDGQAPLGYP